MAPCVLCRLFFVYCFVALFKIYLEVKFQVPVRISDQRSTKSVVRMDILTRDLLKNWGLSDYIGEFCAGKIDAGTLRLLSNDEISQLIPIPGDRARFKANLSNWKQELKGLNEEFSLNTTANASTLSVSDLMEEDASLASFLLGSLKETIGVPPSLIAPPANLSPLAPASPLPSASKELSVPSSSQPLPVPSSSQPLPVPSSSQPLPLPSLSQPLPVPSSSQPLPLDRTSTPIQPSPYQTDYVLQTLKCTHDGKAILNQGQKVGKLDDTQRNLLVKLLISPLFEQDPNIVISNNQLLSWALDIQQLFPKESAALYYTPYISTLVRATARNASGKLLRYVYNRRRQLRDKGIIEGSSRSRSSSTSSQTAKTQSTVAHLKGNTELQDVEEKVTFLKNSLEPWHLVTEYWTATANYRLTKNYSASGTLQEYFNEYPVLKQPAGYNLLLKDFDILYPNKSDGLYINILTLQNKVVELAQKKVANIRDKELKQTIEKYLSAVTDSSSNDTINNACLLLLPFLTSSVPLKDKKKTTWKPSKTEVRDGFITQIGTSGDLETTITARRTKLQRFGKSLQPFIVFVGTSISEISECFVIAGNTYYKFDKLLTAVDVCFKIIHATGAKYQEESFVIWMIIQKGFYRVQTEYDKELTTVNSLLVDLGIK